MVPKLTRRKEIAMFQPDWEHKCKVCELALEPVVPMSGLCGPCHFGTAQALGGDWWHDTKQELKEGF